MAKVMFPVPYVYEGIPCNAFEVVDVLDEHVGYVVSEGAFVVNAPIPQPEPVDYKSMTVKQLKELCELNGIKLTGRERKAELLFWLENEVREE